MIGKAFTGPRGGEWEARGMRAECWRRPGRAQSVVRLLSGVAVADAVDSEDVGGVFGVVFDFFA